MGLEYRVQAGGAVGGDCSLLLQTILNTKSKVLVWLVAAVLASAAVAV